jgi:shikimate kinase
MNVILCGLPMSGKTTVGKMVAEKLNWNFVDTDRLIENAYAAKTGKTSTCRQIFIEEGELIFRNLEKEQVASLKGLDKSMIAVGGGSLNDPENVQMLRVAGKLVYLQASISVLWERIRWRGIPAYLDPLNPEKAFDEMAKKRIPIYERAATVIIETSHLNEQEMMAAILKEMTYGE